MCKKLALELADQSHQNEGLIKTLKLESKLNEKCRKKLIALSPCKTKQDKKRKLKKIKLLKAKICDLKKRKTFVPTTQGPLREFNKADQCGDHETENEICWNSVFFH